MADPKWTLLFGNLEHILLNFNLFGLEFFDNTFMV